MYFQRRLPDQLFAFPEPRRLPRWVWLVSCTTNSSELACCCSLYLLILVSSVGLYYMLHWHWFAKHLMCQALARNALRVKFYLRLMSGEPHLWWTPKRYSRSLV